MTLIALSDRDVAGIRADNSGPFTLTGTNSWLVGRAPTWLIDPGPARPEHLAELEAEIDARGGLGAILLTHDHPDHAEAVPAVRRRFPGVPLAGGRGEAEIRLAEGLAVGPLQAIYTPGHAPDHFAFVAGGLAFTGDAVLGQGSVFIAPDAGALTSYLDGLARLRERRPQLICPGHGPPVSDAMAKLDEYIAHRQDRERWLVAALDAGARSVAEMLDAAWPEVPEVLRPAAAVTLAAHLDKLDDDGRLPPGVERPAPFRLSAPDP